MKNNISRIGLIFLTMIFFLGGAHMFAQETEGNWIQRLSPAELNELLNYRPPADYVEPPKDPLVSGRIFPSRFDWREMNGVTPVRNQANCGGCWAFAATGVVESQACIMTGVPYDFSEQQLVDCTPGCYGCNGGNYEPAWDYLSYAGFDLEEDYPYEAENGECREKDNSPMLRVIEWHYINTDVDSIKAALMDDGPVATVIGANSNFVNYTSGCFQDDSNTDINHAIVIVGWDDDICEGGSWIIRNSWGPAWGDGGYCTIRRGDLHVGEYAAIATCEMLPPIRFRLVRRQIHDGDDGIISAGDTAEVSICLKNIGREDAVHATATITCDHPEIRFSTDTVDVSGTPAGDEVSLPPFVLTADASLQPGEPIQFTVTVESDGVDPAVVTFTEYSGPLYVIYFNDFEGATDEGWTHGATSAYDNWERGIAPPDQPPEYDPPAAYSGDHCWGNCFRNGGSYIRNMSNYLQSPVIDCSRHSRVFFAFRRWLSVEESRYDQARIWVNDQLLWVNERDHHHVDREWVYCVYDITDKLSDTGEAVIKFTLDTDRGLNFGGWNIDDVMLFAVVDDDFYHRFTEPLSCRLEISQPVFHADDIFELAGVVNNYGPSGDGIELVVLDVYGRYWYFPSWSEELDYRMMTYPSRRSVREPFQTFTWPDVSGSASGILFWFAVLDTADGSLLGWSNVSWGWEP